MPQSTNNPATEIRNSLYEIFKNDSYFSTYINTLVQEPLTIYKETYDKIQAPALAVFYISNAEFDKQQGFITNIKETFYVDVAETATTWQTASEKARDLVESVLETLLKSINFYSDLILQWSIGELQPDYSALRQNPNQNDFSKHNWIYLIRIPIHIEYES